MSDRSDYFRTYRRLVDSGRGCTEAVPTSGPLVGGRYLFGPSGELVAGLGGTPPESMAANLTPLPAFSPAIPTLRPDRKGGGTIEITVPHGVSETLVVVHALRNSGFGSCLLAHTSDAYYTVVTHKSGALGLFLPDDIGPLTQSGHPSPTICPGGTYSIYAVGADWPVYEASYPNNLSQLPLIKGSRGQADITTTDTLATPYPK